MRVVAVPDVVGLPGVGVVRVGLGEGGQGFRQGRERLWVGELGARENA